MTKILGLCGKVGSGKNTSANWLFGLKLVEFGYIEHFHLNDKGQLVVPIINEKGELSEGIFDPNDRRQAVVEFLQDLYPHIKLYSFANILKEFCVTVLGLTFEQCFGTNDDKDTLTGIKWEDCPGVITDEVLFDKLTKLVDKYNQKNEKIPNITEGVLKLTTPTTLNLTYRPEGLMTGREVMQYFGTEICRSMSPNCWVDALMNQIQVEGTDLAVITDCRFPNEINGIKQAGGKVIKLLRNPLSQNHMSETQLDQIDQSIFDKVIDNSEMTIEEQNKHVALTLREWNYIEFMEEGNL
jgi:hypothetical protein